MSRDWEPTDGGVVGDEEGTPPAGRMPLGLPRPALAALPVVLLALLLALLVVANPLAFLLGLVVMYATALLVVL